MKEVTKASKRKICESEEMKWDISELCDECPLIESTNAHIQDVIIPEIRQSKNILPPDQFRELLTERIKQHQETLEQIRRDANSNKDQKWDPKRHERIMQQVIRIEAIKIQSAEIQKLDTESTSPELTSDGGPSAAVTQESNLASDDSKEKIKELADFLIAGFISPKCSDIIKGLLLNGHVAGTERITFLGKEKELLGIIKNASEYGFLELGNEDIFEYILRNFRNTEDRKPYSRSQLQVAANPNQPYPLKPDHKIFKFFNKYTIPVNFIALKPS